MVASARCSSILLMQREMSLRYILLPLSKVLMIKSGLEPSFFMVDLCCEVSLGLVACWGWLGRGP